MQNRTFQEGMREGCQHIFNEMKTIEAGLNALNLSTVSLAYKHGEVVESLNCTNQTVLAMQEIMGELQHQLK